MEILQTSAFSKQTKKLHPNQRKDLEQAIRALIADPALGKAKKGDLKGICVYKFRMNNQLTLLAYQYNAKQLILVALGSHENFYRNLK
ncbi:MAG: type II toxin-antitoxin system RelE/ParE family toxin [Bacteroidota bacterium]